MQAETAPASVRLVLAGMYIGAESPVLLLFLVSAGNLLDEQPPDCEWNGLHVAGLPTSALDTCWSRKCSAAVC